MPTKELLRLDHIAQTYQAVNGEVSAIADVSFAVEEGALICIVGPSGCGKSTLLSIIAGLDRPTSGKVMLDGASVQGTSNHIGYMLQKDHLLDWRTIRENALLGLELRKLKTREAVDYTDSLLKNYGLWEFAHKYPAQLSGGMRQRAALIRTLAVRPRILLLDEAFSALDYQTRLAVTDDVTKILKQEHMTTLMVTHDIPESISMGDQIIVLTKRPATIRAIHEILFEPTANTPLLRRNSPKFSGYFNTIWKELDVYV